MGLQNMWNETYCWTAYFFPLSGKGNQDDYFSLSRLRIRYFTLGEMNPRYSESAFKQPSETAWILLGLRETKDDRGLS